MNDDWYNFTRINFKHLERWGKSIFVCVYNLRALSSGYKNLNFMCAADNDNALT